MRISLPAALTSIALFFGVVAAVPASAQSPDTLVCSQAANGGTLVDGVCVLPGARLGQAYEGFIRTSLTAGGTFWITSGSLPPGLSMPSQYGAAGTIVAGTPAQQGTFTFTVKGTDQEGQPLRQAYRIAVGRPAPLIDTTITPLAPGTIGKAYAANFFLSGGVPPYTWSLVSGRFPPGLGLTSTDPPNDNGNQLAGMPTSAGTFAFRMKVTDGRGATASGLVTVTINRSR